MFNKLIAKILGFSIANLKILPIFAPLFDRTPTIFIRGVAQSG